MQVSVWRFEIIAAVIMESHQVPEISITFLVFYITVEYVLF